MQRIGALVVVCVLCLGCQTGPNFEEDGDGFRLTTGSYEFEFSDKGRFDVELRVFGLNPNTNASGPMVAITHMLVATPTEHMKAVFQKNLCEKAAVGQASLVQVMVHDDEVAAELERIGAGGRPCMRISGRSLHLDHLLYNGNELTMDGFSSGQFQADPETYVLVHEVAEVECGHSG